MHADHFDPSIFRTYDIRGKVGDTITATDVHHIARAYATFLQARGPVTIVVGRDSRPSSDQFQDAVVRGLLASGADVVDIGLAPSPLLYFAALRWGAQGAVSVTASHNPPLWNGLKLLGPDGLPLQPHEFQEIRRLGDARRFHQGAGSLAVRPALPEYLEFFRACFPHLGGLPLVADPGNGVTTFVGPAALTAIGASPHTINAAILPNPVHPQDPCAPGAMDQLAAQVTADGAALGVAWDGDGDRLGVADDQGRLLTADQVFCLFARDLLARRPNARVILDVKTSQAVIDTIEQNGGEAIFTRTGHSFCKRRLRQTGALLGGEGSSHFYFGEDYYGLDDAIFGACRLASIIVESGRSLSQLHQGFPSYHTSPEFRLPCPDQDKHTIAQHVADSIRGDAPVLEIDGWRIPLDGGWILVRTANTEPALSIKFEAADRETYAHFQATITQALAEAGLPVGLDVAREPDKVPN